jgi:AraC-like DNA-binding protein
VALAAIAWIGHWWYESIMLLWSIPLSAPPAVVQAWCRVAWPEAVSRHHLHGLWQVHVYHHGGRLEVRHPEGEGAFDLAPGAVSVLPPGASTVYRLGGRPRFSCLHLGLPSGPPTPVPVLVRGDAIAGTLVEEAAGAGDPVRAAALAWAALWRCTAAAAPRPGPVARARALVEERLDDPPSVAELAAAVGCSSAHLRRLFRAETGLGVKPWIQARRLERARHLLCNSGLPVRVIAAQLGVTDLQRFNKMVRRSCGVGPRALRGQGWAGGSAGGR